MTLDQTLINYAINNSFAIVVSLILLFKIEKVIRQNTEAIFKLTLAVEGLKDKICNK